MTQQDASGTHSAASQPDRRQMADKQDLLHHLTGSPQPFQHDVVAEQHRAARGRSPQPCLRGKAVGIAVVHGELEHLLEAARMPHDVAERALDTIAALAEGQQHAEIGAAER